MALRMDDTTLRNQIPIVHQDEGNDRHIEVVAFSTKLKLYVTETSSRSTEIERERGMGELALKKPRDARFSVTPFSASSYHR